jgi:hypothetical protein
MIFNVPGHIDMIRRGIKTQTRRINRGIYQVGRDYAVQSKQGVKAEEGIRVVMDKIKKETGKIVCVSESGREYVNATEIYITKKDAWGEGNYTPSLYELDFRKAYPKWDKVSRWVFEFHVIEVTK